MRDLFSETFKKAKLSTYTISQEHAFYVVREEEEEEEKEEEKKSKLKSFPSKSPTELNMIACHGQ